MRVLTLTYEYPPLGGGGAKVVDGLSRALSARGHEIDIVTMGTGGLPRLKRIDNISVHRIPTYRKSSVVCTTAEMAFYELKAARYVLKLIEARDYDLNHTHFIFPDGVLAMLASRLKHLPYIITAHGSDVPGYNADRFALEHRMLSPLWRSVIAQAKLVVCPSKKLKDLLTAQTRVANTEIIPNGFSADRFASHNSGGMKVLVVSRMFERKGIQYLLQALEGLDLDIEVDIVGEGPYLNELKRLSQRLNSKVKFWGWLENNSDELKSLYEKSNIFVFPSQSENFPNNLLEAMAAGLAIITTRNTGCSEVVGESAILVNSQSASDIRDAILQLSKDPNLCRQLGRDARARVETKFSWSIVAKKYEEAYQGVRRRHGENRN